MVFQVGNEFWKARSSHGRKPVFGSPDALWDACQEYFHWNHDNPLYEHKVFHASGVITEKSVPKMRAMSIAGLCNFLDIGKRTWDKYRSLNDFSLVVEAVEEIIRQQKFEGASADLLNANIIARDLKLVEHTKDTSDKTNYNININSDMPAQEAAALYKQMIKGEE